jgi:hypothetical protein
MIFGDLHGEAVEEVLLVEHDVAEAADGGSVLPQVVLHGFPRPYAVGSRPAARPTPPRIEYSWTK